DMIVVFDLGVGERRLFHHGPEHRALAGVETAIHQELADLAHDLGFGLIVHGEIGPLPIADHTETLELLGLDLDPFLREGAAFTPKFDLIYEILVLASGAIALLHLPFNGKAVAIPARNRAPP